MKEDDISGLLELRDGASEKEGNVYMFTAGNWTPICDNEWTHLDADVACRQLGFTDGIPGPIDMLVPGEGRGTLVKDVKCIGRESNLVDCGYIMESHSTCHPGYTSVICSEGSCAYL